MIYLLLFIIQKFHYKL
uniref:Uncharacterized protein n=1 Tax=Arundo donax TaxID=35708 RepID=A0A0A8YZX1_ARUDO